MVSSDGDLNSVDESCGGRQGSRPTDYKVLYFEGNPISLDLPAAVVLKVTDAEPGIRGDSVSNLTKGATLETGLVVKVPLFIKVGDKVKIDTRSKDYLERVTG